MRHCLYAMTLAALSTGAAVADGRFELRSTTMIAHSDPFAPDDELLTGGPSAFDLETGWDSNTWVRRVQPLSGRQVLRVEGQLRVRGYFDRDELNSVLVTPRLQYWNTTQDNRFQFRLAAGWSALTRDGESHWSRPEAEAQVRYRHAGERTHETVLRLRANAYDFEPDALQGLDSDRVRIGLEQFFRPDDLPVQLRLSAFYETADADEDAFSFDEVRTRAELIWQVDEGLTAAILADYRDREYEGDFSPGVAQPRQDQRWEVEARVERQFTDHVKGFVAAGYLDNESNIAVRDYGGATFRLGFSIAL